MFLGRDICSEKHGESWITHGEGKGIRTEYMRYGTGYKMILDKTLHTESIFNDKE